MLKKRIHIEGMHCVNCAMTIDGTLEDLNGVRAASTHYARQTVDVEYDERTITLDEIVQAIVSVGYKVAD